MKTPLLLLTAWSLLLAPAVDAETVTKVWATHYSGPVGSDDAVRGMAVDHAGNVIVTGSSGYEGDLNYYTAKYAAADGALLWERHYHGPAGGDDSASSVAVDSAGNVVVTGESSNSRDNYEHDYYTAKYAAADGALMWKRRYDGPTHGNDSARCVAVDPAGNIVVTGSSVKGIFPSQTDFYTAKYAAADGALLWEKLYSTSGYSSPSSMALDSDGNVIVTGSSQIRSDLDYYTAKYAAADGTLLWEQRYNSQRADGSNGSDVAMNMALDSAGNVIVTGKSTDASGLYNYYTAKYAAADGTLLWERRYKGPINDEVWNPSVAVDRAGNVIVTGESAAAGHYSDYYTAKYAAADGALLWEQSYDGPASGNDVALGVAVDQAGNAIVTGFSTIEKRGVREKGAFYTAKYAAADGALLWEKRFQGPTRDSAAVKIIVTAGGGVVVAGYAASRLPLSAFTLDFLTVRYAQPVVKGDVLISKRAGGDFVGEGIVNLTGKDQKVTALVSAGGRKAFTVKVRNAGDQIASFTLAGSAKTAGFQVRYGDETNADITAEVLAGTYRIDGLAPGAEKTIGVAVTVKSNAPHGAVKTCVITASQAGEAEVVGVDTVKAQVTVR